MSWLFLLRILEGSYVWGLLKSPRMLASGLETGLISETPGKVFGIEIWGLLDLLKLMHTEGRITVEEIKSLLDYLDYMKDLPYPSFKKLALKEFKKRT
jgi:hypothetical protein